MPYELSDYEWSVIRPMLPNKPRRATAFVANDGRAATVGSACCKGSLTGRSHAEAPKGRTEFAASPLMS